MASYDSRFGHSRRAIVKVLGAPVEMVSRQVLNVGDDDLNITIGELAEVVSKVVDRDKTGRRVHITVDDDIQDTRNYRVSFEKIRNILGFRAQIGVEGGDYRNRLVVKKWQI